MGNNRSKILWITEPAAMLALLICLQWVGSMIPEPMTKQLITGSLVNAGAIIEYIRRKNPETVSLVCMGLNCLHPIEEDTLCAEYIKALLEEDGRGFSSREDARMVLPQAASTNIVVSMNCRTLLNFFEHRCCTRAQWEIRGVVREMLLKLNEVSPEIFGGYGPSCAVTGRCPEGKMSCGHPVKIENGIWTVKGE